MNRRRFIKSAGQGAVALTLGGQAMALAQGQKAGDSGKLIEGFYPANIVRLKDGSLVTEGGEQSTDGGRTWRRSETFKSVGVLGLLRLPNGELGTYYADKWTMETALGNDTNNWFFRWSADDGKSWSEPVQITLPGLTMGLTGTLFAARTSRRSSAFQAGPTYLPALISPRCGATTRSVSFPPISPSTITPPSMSSARRCSFLMRSMDARLARIARGNLSSSSPAVRARGFFRLNGSICRRSTVMKQIPRIEQLTVCLIAAIGWIIPGTQAALFGEPSTSSSEVQPMNFKPHHIKQGDGKGGWVLRPAEYQILHAKTGNYAFPFGVAQMDNGEVFLLCSWHDGKSEHPVIAFSKDRGASWTEFEPIPEAAGRPMMLTYLGGGRLTFQSDQRYYSSDYGRTWKDRVPAQPSSDGGGWGVEGNAWVDRDAKGNALRIAEIGWHYDKGLSWPKDPATGMVRWSTDGGRTWTKEVAPKEWKWEEQFAGKTYTRGVSEGSIVRAANGWLVAALRADMPARYLEQPNDDSLEGTGVSLSKDDGATWSPVKILYDAGRHHAHLLRTPNGDLVMTLIVRDDVQGGALASYRRGCDAILSHDNGLTWDLKHKYSLDDFEFYDGAKWYNGECGHLYSTLLDDGSILTCYANYLTKGASLIRWKPSRKNARK